MSKSKGKMRSKTKIGVRKPPLSLLDLMIYLVSFPLAVAVGFGVLKLYYMVFDMLADPTVLVRSGDGFLFVLIVVLLWWFGSFWFLCRMVSKKQPIFGNAQVTYGAFPWKKDLFPIFGDYPEKKKLKPETYQSRKKRREHMIMVGIGFLCFCVLIIYSGIYGACLREDHGVTVFRITSEGVKYVYTPDDFAELEISAHYHSGGKGTSFWDLSMAIGMEDGKAVRFCLTDFDVRDLNRHIVALETITAIKGRFSPDSITVEGEEKIEYLIEKYDYEGEYARILRELFDLE